MEVVKLEQIKTGSLPCDILYDFDLFGRWKTVTLPIDNDFVRKCRYRGFLADTYFLFCKTADSRTNYWHIVLGDTVGKSNDDIRREIEGTIRDFRERWKLNWATVRVYKVWFLSDGDRDFLLFRPDEMITEMAFDNDGQN